MAIHISDAFATFNTFVQFAEHRNGAGLKGAAADAVLNFDRRNISAVTVGSASKTSAGWFTRTGNDKIANDRTREIFKAAIAKMFGGESKIPADVVKAMEMENYGQGKPLTARRILLVKAAIDKTDAPAREAELKFQAVGQKVFDKLLPSLARATRRRNCPTSPARSRPTPSRRTSPRPRRRGRLRPPEARPTASPPTGGASWRVPPTSPQAFGFSTRSTHGTRTSSPSRTRTR